MIHFSRFSVSTNSIKLKVDRVGKKHLCSKYFIIQYSYMQTCWILKLLALSHTLVELFPASYRAILSSSSWPLLNCWLLKAEDTLRGTEAPRMMSIDTAGCQKPSNSWRHQSRWLERWEWGTYVLRINQAQSAPDKAEGSVEGRKDEAGPNSQWCSERQPPEPTTILPNKQSNSSIPAVKLHGSVSVSIPPSTWPLPSPEPLEHILYSRDAKQASWL